MNKRSFSMDVKGFFHQRLDEADVSWKMSLRLTAINAIFFIIKNPNSRS